MTIKSQFTIKNLKYDFDLLYKDLSLEGNLTIGNNLSISKIGNINTILLDLIQKVNRMYNDMYPEPNTTGRLSYINFNMQNINLNEDIIENLEKSILDEL